MAIVRKNLITQGLSGMLGGTLVFRRVGIKTVVSTVPSTTKAPTEAQQEQRGKFTTAVQYAKAAMANQALKAEYEALARAKGQPNAYNSAIADYFTPPSITQVDLTRLPGVNGQPVRITAVDDFRVKSVTVDVFDPGGGPLQSGDANLQVDTMDWLFITNDAFGAMNGLKFVIKATDMAGNVTEKQVTKP